MFQTVIVGGTFDKIHKGHVAILTRAFGEGQRVIIGLTSDAYVAKYKKSPAGTYEQRKDALLKWLSDNGYQNRVTIVPIDDPYEPAASEPYNAIVVTSETRERGEEINTQRDRRNLAPLTLIEVPLITAEDGLPISSTRVKAGVIDATGHLIMPDTLRETLSHPIGRVLLPPDVDVSRNNHARDIIVTVGDVTTHNFMQAGLMPSLAILDCHVRRRLFQELDKYIFPEGTLVMNVVSGPGYISRTAEDAIRAWAVSSAANPTSHTVIAVDGEEDLLTLPVLLSAPLEAVVYYGQPPVQGNDGGLVEVIVTEEIKRKAEQLLKKFTK